MNKKTEFKERLIYGDQYTNVKLQRLYRDAIEKKDEAAAQMVMSILVARLDAETIRKMT